jgi:MFS family permease
MIAGHPNTTKDRSVPHDRDKSREADARMQEKASLPAIIERPPAPSRASLRGLDWFVFSIANVQTGFGPFIAIYLTDQKWTQVDIGMLLTVGGLVALVGQVPGGALVDAVRSERRVSMVAVAIIAASALMLALWPLLAIVLAAQVLHAAASCVLGPAIGAISLGLVGHFAIADRLGRNACFASIGNGLSAAAMGAIGYYVSNQAVFVLTAALCVPTIVALAYIRDDEIDPARAHGGIPDKSHGELASEWVFVRGIVGNRALMVFAGAVVLFQLANTAMLPLIGSTVTMRSSHLATVMVAACIVAPQLLVALSSPWVGHQAQLWGRRPLLIIGFAALPVRAVLVATTVDPYLLVAVQALDGISAAVLGVLVPLVIADTTRGTGHFNLAQGVVGAAVGIGASFSTTLAGYLTDQYGSSVAFLGLASVALLGLGLVVALMPETRPENR